MDLLILYLSVAVTASLLLNVLFLLGFRYFSARFANIPAMLQGFIDSFLWEEAEEVGSDGVKRVVRKPSAQFMAAVQSVVPVVMPVLVKEGVEWAKKNVKIGPGGAGGGLGGMMGGMVGPGIGKSLGLKGGLAQIVDTFAPGLIQKFLGGMGGAAKPAEASASTNPFLKQ